MSEKYINIDLDDARIGKIADVISNKTCKKILDVLTEKEMSAGEISDELKIPLNTAGYNLDKLNDAGLIEKKKEFLWSEKGKRIIRYKLANKKIVISPKSSFNGVISALALTALGSLGIKLWYDSSTNYSNLAVDSSENVASISASKMLEVGNSGAEIVTQTSFGEPALWFFFGALVALAIVLAWNWRKIW